MGGVAKMTTGEMLQPKGQDAIQRRMSEIQAKLAQFDGHPGGPDFAAEMQSRMKKIDSSIAPFDPLTGQIGGPDQTALRKMARDAAAKAGIEPELYDSLIEVESSYNPATRSKSSALGLAQLMPDTAKELGVQDPFDPKQNLEAGALYLRQMLDKFGGDRSLALAAYNAGPSAVLKAGGIPTLPETQRYVPNVLRRYELKKGIR